MVIASPEIQRELLPGERVLWAGRPLGGLRFDTRHWFEPIFGLLFMGPIVWPWITDISATRTALEKLSWSSVGANFFQVPFIAIGLYFVIGKFFFDAFARARTEYAITNHRVIARTTYFGRATRSIDYRKYPNIILKENSDNSGAIVFGEPQQQGEGKIAPPSLVALADARSVYNIIRKAAAAPV